jgi:hypothetical protein
MVFIIERQCVYCEVAKQIGRFRKTIAKTTFNFFISASPSVRTEQLWCYSTYFLKAVYWELYKTLLTSSNSLLMNQHHTDTLFLVCLLVGNPSTCSGRYSPTFRRLCTGAIWYNYMRRMCVDYRNLHVVNAHPTHVITPNSICAESSKNERVTPETQFHPDSDADTIPSRLEPLLK